MPRHAFRTMSRQRCWEAGLWWKGDIHLFLTTTCLPLAIAGDLPVSENQVRQKLQSDGWSNVQIVRNGNLFEAMGQKDGQTMKIAVDAQTGRLRAADDDDDD